MVRDTYALKKASGGVILTAKSVDPNVLNITRGRGILWGIEVNDLDDAAQNDHLQIVIDDVDTGDIAQDFATGYLPISLRRLLGISVIEVIHADKIFGEGIPFGARFQIWTWRAAAGALGFEVVALYSVRTF